LDYYIVNKYLKYEEAPKLPNEARIAQEKIRKSPLSAGLHRME
jgi:hypothetical protein